MNECEKETDKIHVDIAKMIKLYAQYGANKRISNHKHFVCLQITHKTFFGIGNALIHSPPDTPVSIYRT